ncbi:MAG: hypothetical protein ACKO0Z_04580 [Betaproteobacteria bacterium]
MTKPRNAAELTDLHLEAIHAVKPIGGYAPGNYMGVCQTCHDHIEGIAKRATQCLGCALTDLAKLANFNKPQPTQNAGYNTMDVFIAPNHLEPSYDELVADNYGNGQVIDTIQNLTAGSDIPIPVTRDTYKLQAVHVFLNKHRFGQFPIPNINHNLTTGDVVNFHFRLNGPFN